jgi:hypothetical protein
MKLSVIGAGPAGGGHLPQEQHEYDRQQLVATPSPHPPFNIKVRVRFQVSFLTF